MMQKISADGQHMMTTTFFISNLHCPSCITSIDASLEILNPQPISVSYSIISHSITIRHNSDLVTDTITSALENAGFEVYSVAHGQHVSASDWQPERVRPKSDDWGLEQAVSHWKQAWKDTIDDDSKKRKRHMEQCVQCQNELRSVNSSDGLLEKKRPETRYSLGSRKPSMASEPPATAVPLTHVESATPEVFKAEFSIGGMTCSACVGNVTRAISQCPWVQKVNVVLLSNSATVVFSGKGNEKQIVEAVDDAGYDISLEDLKNESPEQPEASTGEVGDTWKASFAITGMTCSACVGAITTALEPPEWIDTVQVNLISNSATVTFKGRERLEEIKEMIEDLGYDAIVQDVQGCSTSQTPQSNREVALRVAGMYCHHCPERVLQSILDNFENRVKVEAGFSTSSPLLRLSYVPRSPGLTIRDIVNVIDAVDTDIEATIHHPPTIEQRSREIQSAERKKILHRLVLSVVVAIPTFIIGIVYMSLVSRHAPGRTYLMAPIWAGQVSRAEWSLFIMGSVIYFFAADIFHTRTYKSLVALWRPGSRTPMSDRFLRFGNMNMLICLGTSIAYFASVAALALDATSKSSTGSTTYYFDSVVFLTMFLLAGRYLEAHSKAKTGDAVTALGSLRPSTALLVRPGDTVGVSTPTELLELGDVVRIPHGSTPPFDGTLLTAAATFDESSLTGEARPIAKAPGDTVYAGTINAGGPATSRLTSVSGASLLDAIIATIREGQTRRAPVERAADVLTSYFVPCIVGAGVATWAVWLGLGEGGALPAGYLDTTKGWPFWSLQFAIAVFVVACPCGIGLAAPTALFVGGGLAAREGVLVKGGGEAFQEASGLDCVVFDKTGTLTRGGSPAVVASWWRDERVLGLARVLEETSSHPVARAVAAHCGEHEGPPVADVQEMAGRGMKGRFRTSGGGDVVAVVGNEALMLAHGVHVDAQTAGLLDEWKRQGMSIALLSTSDSGSSFRLGAAFAISDPLRPEAQDVVRSLQGQGLQVWLISGDNATTAHSVGAAVGIAPSNIIAGVLPSEKADRISNLQRTLSPRSSWFRRSRRATVAMVGDGINDAPALAMADVSVAIGSGSDVAMSTASFVLVTSDLRALVRLIELSRVVFRRVWINFAWALLYNLVALPVAAGALYAVRSNGGHVRLDPVWASLAMALSSVSVVCSSLALRTGLPIIGFRASRKRERAG